MDFTVSEELGNVQQLAQQILGDFTEVDKLKVIDQQDERFDAELWKALAEAGLLGLDIAESQGGIDLGFYSLTTLCEEVGRTVAPVPVVEVLVGAASTSRYCQWHNPCERSAGRVQQRRPHLACLHRE